jgi:WD40 repeat protein
MGSNTMNDDFLHQFREPPSNQYAENLHSQLFEEANTMPEVSPYIANISLNGHVSRRKAFLRPQWMTLVAAIFALLILGGMVIVSRILPQTLHTQSNDSSFLDHLQLISAENASQLTQVAQIGRGLISQAAWSPDGKLLAISGTQGVWLHDADNLSESPILLMGSVPADSPSVTFNKTGSPNPTDIPAASRSIAFSPDGDFLAMADGGQVRIWNPTNHQIIIDLDAKTSFVRAVAFSPDGKWLATGGGKQDDDPSNFIIRLWDTTTWKEHQNFGDQTSPIRNLVFSPDGSILASENQDGAYLWDMSTSKMLHALRWRSTQPTLSGMAFSPDGKTIALADSPTISLWNVQIGKRIDNIDLADLVNKYSNGDNFEFLASIFPDIKDLTFSPDGQLLAIESSVLGLVLWDTQSKQFLSEKHDPWQILYQSANLSFSAAFSPDGGKLASVEYSGLVNIMDTQTHTLQPIPGYLGAILGFLNVSTDSHHLAFSEYERWGVSFYDLISMSKTNQISLDKPNYPIGISPDWKWLVATGGHFEGNDWNSSGIKFIDALSGDDLKTTINEDAARTRTGIGVFSTDGHYFATTTENINGKNGTLRLWNVVQFPTLTDPLTYQYTNAGINSITFNPNHTLLAAGLRIGDWGSKQGELLLMDVASGDMGSVWEYPYGSLNQLHFAPDGHVLAASTETGILLFDTQTNSIIRKFGQSNEAIARNAFSPDGSLLAATLDDTLYVWNTETGKVIFSHGLEKGIDFQENSEIAFSPDGRFVVTAGNDGQVRIWGISNP